MIIIDDERRILNLNHMAIYLMLTAEEMAMYGDKLKRLNNYRRVTRGIFRFEIVEKGSMPYEQLPKEMTRGAARACNLLVRLVNSIHKIYCYGLDFVDMSLDSDSIHNELNLIVDEICRKNIFQLDILEYRNTGTAMSALQMYRNCNKEHLMEVLSLRTIFLMFVCREFQKPPTWLDRDLLQKMRLQVRCQTKSRESVASVSFQTGALISLSISRMCRQVVATRAASLRCQSGWN